MKKYLRRVGVALSILLNIILGGPSNQSFSARNYYWKINGKPNLVWLIDFIADKVFRHKDHCLAAWTYWYTIVKNKE